MPGKGRYLAELRRSSAASPVDRTLPRGEEIRRAIEEELTDMYLTNVSTCCNAPVKVEGKTTHYYVCTQCDEPCDVRKIDVAK